MTNICLVVKTEDSPPKKLSEWMRDELGTSKSRSYFIVHICSNPFFLPFINPRPLHRRGSQERPKRSRQPTRSSKGYLNRRYGGRGARLLNAPVGYVCVTGSVHQAGVLAHGHRSK